jgi:GntR family transcriptional regulator / MocR family aminotransferase
MRTAIAIDARSSTPLHRQIYDAWRQAILAGRFRGGERLPSTRELANALQVARSTVTQAYEQLLAEGYLQTTHGAGTFVCRELPDEALRPTRAQRSETVAPQPIRLSRHGAALITDFQYAPQPAGFICFSRFSPDVAEFPLALWRKLLMRALRRPSAALLDYAREPHGYEPLRREIAAYVARARAVRCTPDQVVVLNGSQQALEICARVLCDPGDEIGCENPGYFGTQRIFNAYRLRLRPARVDQEGLVVSDLGRRAKLVYVTPSHQFPTGVAMSLKRRLELIAWARAQSAVIIEDDYDSEFRYDGSPLPALQGLSPEAPVVYCGTFSKVMFPALRIGYAILPAQLAPIFARAKWLSDRHTPVLEQAALVDFIAEGWLERHIRRMRRLYGRRREVLIEALDKYCGEHARVCGDPAGMHIMLRVDQPGFAARAARNKVQILSTRECYLSRARDDEFILGFSRLGERAIREGVRRLALQSA